MQITRPALAALRIELNAALAAVATKHGIAIDVGSCSYTETSATFKLAIATNATPGESTVDAKAKSDWAMYATMFGLKVEWLGAEVKHRHDVYTIIGIMPKRHKFPVYVQSKTTGKKVLLTADEIQLRLNASVAPVARRTAS